MLTDVERDEFYTQCAQAINTASRSREGLLLARLALLLADEVGDIERCQRAIVSALKDLPEPTLAV
jgi:hypothetical protein